MADESTDLRLRLKRGADREAGLMRAWKQALDRETAAKDAAKRAELDAQAKVREARKLLAAALKRTQDCEAMLDEAPPPPAKAHTKKALPKAATRRPATDVPSRIRTWHAAPRGPRTAD